MSAPLPDPRNAEIWVHVGGRLVPRSEAKVSVFDSSVQGGDACWEGLRVYDGRIFAVRGNTGMLLAAARPLQGGESRSGGSHEPSDVDP